MCVHLVYATDSRYLFPTFVSVSSAIAWASRRKDLKIHILDCGFADSEWNVFVGAMHRRFGDEVELFRHTVDMRAYEWMKKWHTSRGIYARLEIPQKLSDVDWCVYADGDTLFTADPFMLSSLKDSRFALMGHLDDFGQDQIDWHVKHGLPWRSDTHVCAGFIMMNLKWFRTNGATAKCFELLERYPDIPYNDQDVLNVVCDGKIGLLPDGWGNFVNYRDYRKSEFKGCFHYTVKRPWEHQTSRKFQLVPQVRIWFSVLRHSCGLFHPLCPKRIRRWYFREMFRLYFYTFVYKVLNCLPHFKGRYNRILGELWWPKELMQRLTPVWSSK